MSYKIYLDKDEIFECEANIKNASYKDSSARIIIESKDVNLVFYGQVDRDTITVPIKSLKKFFKEEDNANIKLEVIVESTIVTPWESELEFDSYNKVEIKEIKNVRHKPIIEVKLKKEEKSELVNTPKPEKQTIVNEKVETNNPENLKADLLKYINEEIKKIKSNGHISKEEKKELIKNILKNGL
jgi:hypothetical protein